MKFPNVLHIGSSGVVEEYTAESMEEIERDPRGLLLMFEPPDPKGKYIMGLDPSEGITGWSRATRTDGDHKTDNGAIVVIKIDGIWEPIFKVENGKKVMEMDPYTKKPKRHYRDVQVAEYAAPCDAVEIARVAAAVGKIYAGEDDECELIWEAWPGPGLLSTQELLRLNYSNLWVSEYIDNVARENGRIGWFSTRESQKLLWYRSRRHLMNRNVVIKSKWLLEEYANAEIDVDKMRARAAYGYHDDRFQAANMAFWGGHKWTYDVDRPDDTVRERPLTDYQLYAPTLDDHVSYSDWKENCLADWD